MPPKTVKRPIFSSKGTRDGQLLKINKKNNNKSRELDPEIIEI